MNEILVLAGIISGIVLGLVKLVKEAEVVPKRFLPLVGLLIGVFAGLLSMPFSDLDVGMRLWAGLVAGLTATGFFELVKPITKGDVKIGNKQK